MASANISITLEVKVVTHEDGESHRVEVGGTPATAWLTDAGVLALRDALLAKWPVGRWEPTQEVIVDQWRNIVWQNPNSIEIQGSHAEQLSAEIPPNIRLCRLMTPEGAP